jgi:hypothetical protein
MSFPRPPPFGRTLRTRTTPGRRLRLPQLPIRMRRTSSFPFVKSHSRQNGSLDKGDVIHFTMVHAAEVAHNTSSGIASYGDRYRARRHRAPTPPRDYLRCSPPPWGARHRSDRGLSAGHGSRRPCDPSRRALTPMSLPTPARSRRRPGGVITAADESTRSPITC